MVVVENLIRCSKEGEVEYNYYYRILKDKVVLDYNGESTEVQSYGIEIERQDIIDENIINIERDYVKCISPQRHKVHKLLKLLHENAVSPIHLIDVLGEYIDEYIIDFDKELMNIATN
ncbi:hypothetical protein BD780_003425 [Clostridium tetanomorphum]|uniref:Uncharacterized protein n=1 Tax=Clostridium tetanomorphum TaxID=1553 RepID=A0A923E6X3_CLOTT|nr:DUF6514 family protein [Clostridium tetanomorphum]KAJ53222.1 hypothetical protein CTM_04125 [Clostridium tetanomorphum DSM 665]MBC2397528.1 hypothetical protein [Clostridium tetanomorphum]MBP1863624.1 hypothetical protein [Clostridium tetanomorphum]NRS86200.1 hypothetical protein [Clostridium tetanomorphum]NRZ95721.1 hypothetical protein [Clostridium tetanomorphum]